MNQRIEHAALIASYRKLDAETKMKMTMAAAAAGKGPGAVKSTTETAEKAKRRRDVVASKLTKLGVVLTD